IWDSGAKVERDGGGWSGNDFPPTLNKGPGADFGNDPHSSPRSTVAARQQKSAFMQRDGAVTDVCADAPCCSDDYTGVSRLPWCSAIGPSTRGADRYLASSPRRATAFNSGVSTGLPTFSRRQWVYC